jgi:hypothetical protein
MGSQSEGGVLDTHFGNKTYVDICRINLVEKKSSEQWKKKQFVNIQWIACLGMKGCMSTTPTAAMETLMGLSPLQLVVEKKARQVAYRLHCSKNLKKSDWEHSAIFKIATEDFPVFLAPSLSMLPMEVCDRKYLVEYFSREI